MKTETLSPPPRPPRNGNFTSDVGEPDGGETSGRHAVIIRWCRMFLKLVVVVLFVIATVQLSFILFQTVRLWFFP